jgi:hypothetical protein
MQIPPLLLSTLGCSEIFLSFDNMVHKVCSVGRGIGIGLCARSGGHHRRHFSGSDC